MLQLYYLYCKFKDANPNFPGPGSPDYQPMIFRDQGRAKTEFNPHQIEQNRYLIESEAVETNNTSANNLSVNSNWKASNNSANISTGGMPSATNIESQAIGESRDHNMMGIIEEEDCVDLSQSIRSQLAKEGQNTYT